MYIDDAFDEDWKQEVESKIKECCNNLCQMHVRIAYQIGKLSLQR